MKISILITDEAKQIMMTPENEHERAALKMIAPGDKIEAETKWGTFFNAEEKLVGYDVEKCQGGYYRAYASDDSLMFIITPKSAQKRKEER